MASKRRISPRQQGDLGEASAIEWLTRQGAVVFAPIGHSPDVDLVALVSGRALRVQVKTTACRSSTASGRPRWKVAVATRGGNRSWSGVAKLLDREAVDLLFVLAGDGRRWLIPASDLQGTTAVSLGGSRYSEFEIEPGNSIDEVIDGLGRQSLESIAARGSVGVWRAERDCKFRALALSEFESHLPHEPAPPDSGLTRVSKHHQVTIPMTPFARADLRTGDRLKVCATGPGSVTLERINDEGPRPGGPSDRSSPFEAG